MSELGGGVAIITGASSGIGQAVARALDAEGMRLVLTGRRVERLDEVARALREAVVVPGDITDAALPEALIERARRVRAARRGDQQRRDDRIRAARRGRS
jgi:NADP-dependent 3-hydroxy acid dehydrogenase YdfG